VGWTGVIGGIATQMVILLLPDPDACRQASRCHHPVILELASGGILFLSIKIAESPGRSASANWSSFRAARYPSWSVGRRRSRVVAHLR
jgi:hypothetical protein